MYKIKVSTGQDFEAEFSNERLTLNGSAVHPDIQKINDSVYHVINDYGSYTAEVISFNKDEKTASIKVNGNIYELTAKDRFDLLLDQMGLSNLQSAKVSEIKAPMPGLVLKVFVSNGDEVKKGDNLFILEAMKMENIIKSPSDVSIKNIKIVPGDKVEKGQVLMQFN
jgi:biotin carboxyl carrier protein